MSTKSDQKHTSGPKPATTTAKASILRLPVSPIVAAVGSPVRDATVGVTLTFANNQAQWTFNPPSVEMATGRVTITFNLSAPSGFKFQSYVPNSNPSQPPVKTPFLPMSARGAAFSPSLDTTGLVLTVTDVNTVPHGQPASTINYCINVIDATGTQYSSDPTIVNDPADPPGHN